jgi:hypothetical protein
MGKHFLLLSITVIFFNCFDARAQQNDISLLLKVGNSDYNDSIGSFGGGGPDYTYWHPGPKLSAGIEILLNRRFSFQGLASFSIYNFDEKYSWGNEVNDATNRLYDLMANIKLNIGIFYLLGGIGFSYQNGDEVDFLEYSQYHQPGKLYNAKDKFVVAGLFGLGFDIKIYKQYSLIAEADINMREYMGSAAMLGIKYSLINF